MREGGFGGYLPEKDRMMSVPKTEMLPSVKEPHLVGRQEELTALKKKRSVSPNDQPTRPVAVVRADREVPVTPAGEKISVLSPDYPDVNSNAPTLSPAEVQHDRLTTVEQQDEQTAQALVGMEWSGGRVESAQEIGRGAYGVTYEVVVMPDRVVSEAEQQVVARRYALKLLERPPVNDLMGQSTIDREIQALGAAGMLIDSKPVTVDGTEYISVLMSYVEGENIRQPKNEWEQVESEVHERRQALFLSYLSSLDQLTDVHDSGWLHMDIKPGNIRFNAKATYATRMIDFGISTRMQDVDPDAKEVKGTLAYLTSERLHGAPPSQIHDLYALCLSFQEGLGAVENRGLNPSKKDARAHMLESYKQLKEGSALVPVDVANPDALEARGLRAFSPYEAEFSRLLDRVICAGKSEAERMNVWTSQAEELTVEAMRDAMTDLLGRWREAEPETWTAFTHEVHQPMDAYDQAQRRAEQATLELQQQYANEPEVVQLQARANRIKELPKSDPTVLEWRVQEKYVQELTRDFLEAG